MTRRQRMNRDMKCVNTILMYLSKIGVGQYVPLQQVFTVCPTEDQRLVTRLLEYFGCSIADQGIAITEKGKRYIRLQFRPYMRRR